MCLRVRNLTCDEGCEEQAVKTQFHSSPRVAEFTALHITAILRIGQLP